jgi:hypothetical protein
VDCVGCQFWFSLPTPIEPIHLYFLTRNSSFVHFHHNNVIMNMIKVISCF